MRETFEQFGLSSEIIETLRLLGYNEPTPIQREAIPLIQDKKDLVGKSQTGSGKTAAFGIPVCNDMVWEENEPQALVLEPTRELAVQVKDELFLLGRKKRLKVPVVFGGMPIDKEIISLKQKAHIVVGTPGRVGDHIRRGSLELQNIRYLVIDEADLMLDMGFIDEVQMIIKSLPHKPTMLLFSATFDERIDTIIKEYMVEPKRIVIESETETVQGITQYMYEVDKEEKFSLLMEVLKSENPTECIVFCDTREMVNALYQQLKRKKVRCGMLHGAMEQRDRLYSISDFRKGMFHILVTTDVAARGIDFPDISHVINYDFPTKRENYVHRVGRTARNGRDGIAISLVGEEELHYVKNLEEYADITLERRKLPAQTDGIEFFQRQKGKIIPKTEKGARLNKDIMRLMIGGGKKSKMRAGDVVGAICSIKDIMQEDIGVIDIRDSLTYVEILNGKGSIALNALQYTPVKGKLRKVERS